MYVREAHPGELYSHHASFEQKLRHAGDWAREDRVRWTVAVDDLEGTTHRAYGALPHSLYLVGSTGVVAFRALWGSKAAMSREHMQELLSREAAGERPVVLGEGRSLILPVIQESMDYLEAVERGGKKALEDFRREMEDLRPSKDAENP